MEPNLAENATQPYAPLDTEFVLASNPQLIVIGGGIWRNNAEGDQMSMGLTIDEATAQKRLKGFAERPLGRISLRSSLERYMPWITAASGT